MRKSKNLVTDSPLELIKLYMLSCGAAYVTGHVGGWALLVLLLQHPPAFWSQEIIAAAALCFALASLANGFAYSRAVTLSVAKRDEPKSDFIEAIAGRDADVIRYRPNPANAFQYVLNTGLRLIPGAMAELPAVAEGKPTRERVPVEEFFIVNQKRIPGGQVRYFLLQGYDYQQDHKNGFSRSLWAARERWPQTRWSRVRLVIKLGCIALEAQGIQVAQGYGKRETFRLLVTPSRAYAQLSGALLAQGKWIRRRS